MGGALNVLRRKRRVRVVGPRGNCAIDLGRYVTAALYRCSSVYGLIGAVGVVYTGSPSTAPGFIQWSATGPSWPVRSLLVVMAALAVVLFVLPKPSYRRVAAWSTVLLSAAAAFLLFWGRPPLGIQVYGFHFDPTVGLYAAALGGLCLVLLGLMGILRRP